MHTSTDNHRRITVRTLIALAVAVMALAVASSADAWSGPQYTPASPTTTTTRYVSSSKGNDANSGTEAAPWRTLAKAASAATPGTTVILEPGTYGGYGVTTNISHSGTSTAAIVFTSAPGQERAVVHGYVRVTASYVHLQSLVFAGPTGAVVAKTSENPGGEEVEVSFMGGTGIELSRSEISGSAWHAGVFISKVTGAVVTSNYVHNNGDAATGPNLDHGIYWCSGSGTMSNNVVVENVAWGIQLYPNATNVLVSHNTVERNGRGGIIVARESSYDTVANNLVANNSEYGIRGYSLTGAGNSVRENLLWNNHQDIYGSGFTSTGNVIKNPSTLTTSLLAPFGAKL